jgi:hypothetical protein
MCLESPRIHLLFCFKLYVAFCSHEFQSGTFRHGVACFSSNEICCRTLWLNQPAHRLWCLRIFVFYSVLSVGRRNGTLEKDIVISPSSFQVYRTATVLLCHSEFYGVFKYLLKLRIVYNCLLLNPYVFTIRDHPSSSSNYLTNI